MAFKFGDKASVERIVRSVLDSERRLQNPVPPAPPPVGGESGWFKFKNEYAGEVPGRGVIRITSGVAIDNRAGSYYKATRPDTTFGLYAVNSRVPVAQGAFGFCAFYGIREVLYESSSPAWTPALGDGGGPMPNSFKLGKNFPGMVRAHSIHDSTNKILLGSLEPINSLLCKATADNAAGALATDTSDYKIYKGTAGSEADAGFTTQPAIYAREAISNNEFFTASFIDGLWYADIETGRVLMYKALLNGALASTDGTATIDNVTCFGGGTPPSPTSATNTLALAGADNDDVVIVKDGTGYYLLNVKHHACD